MPALRAMAYRFDFEHPGRVHVVLETMSPESGVETLEVPTRWAEARELERAIEDLKITGSEVSLRPEGRPGRLTLRAKPDTPMRLEYDLVQDWTGPVRASQRHRVLVGPRLTEWNGHNGLVAPRTDGAAPVSVTFDFVHLPAGQRVVTSFGTGNHQTMSGVWSEVANAMFAEGELSLHEMTVGGGPVLLAIAGHWSFSESELVEAVRRVLAAERAFWGTPPPPWYAAVVAPYETGTSGGGGSAFTNGFSVFLAPGERVNAETEALLAHEAFHAWNPARMGAVSDPEHLRWFVEGFTTYYQDALLERGGVMDRAEYLKRLNAELREVLAPEPATTIRPEEGSALDDEEARSREPYSRGAVIALWLNAEIARRTGGRRSLDDLMRALLTQGTPALTAERIYAAAARYAGAATAAELREMAENAGAAVPIEPTMALPCVEFRTEAVWTFALGLPASALRERAVLHEVDREGAAYRAGARDGQTVLGWSLWRGDPEHAAVLTVLDPESGGMKRITYLPRGEQVRIAQAVMVPGCSVQAGDARKKD